MGSLLSTLMVGSTLIDFMRCRISRMLMIYSVLSSIFFITVDFLSSDGSRRCVIDRLRELDSKLMSLSRSLSVSFEIYLSSLPMTPSFFMEAGCSFNGSNLTLRRFLSRSLLISILKLYILVQ
jgi:hypothetical protein